MRTNMRTSVRCSPRERVSSDGVDVLLSVGNIPGWTGIGCEQHGARDHRRMARTNLPLLGLFQHSVPAWAARALRRVPKRWKSAMKRERLRGERTARASTFRAPAGEIVRRRVKLREGGREGRRGGEQDERWEGRWWWYEKKRHFQLRPPFPRLMTALTRFKSSPQLRKVESASYALELDIGGVPNRKLKIVALRAFSLGLKQSQAETGRRYACFAAPSCVPQHGSGSSQRSSGQSCVGSTGTRPLLSESSDAHSVRGVITRDTRTARSSESPQAAISTYNLRARSEAETYGSVARVGHERCWVGVLHGRPAREHRARGGPGLQELVGGAVSRVEPGSRSPAGVVKTPNSKRAHSTMRTGELAAEVAFAALHPSTTFVSTASSATSKHPTSASEHSASSSASEFADPLKRRSYPSAPSPPPSPARPRTRTQRAPGLRRTPRAHGERALRRGGYNAPGTGAVDCGASWEDGGVRADRVSAFEPQRSTDLMSSVALTGTNHAAGEAMYLRVASTDLRCPRVAVDTQGAKANGEGEKGGVDAQEMRRVHVAVNVGTYAEPLQRACPAAVYEYVADDGGRAIPGTAGYGSYDKLQADGEAERLEGTRFRINSQDITWTVPEGGNGPSTCLPEGRLAKFVRRSKA
ncbi:hypothetical protein DFH09DRAFT_1482409 [Mycena vulgaris]|nr:hypothetical protein DFH09DRAFT_1482409 [Mycena vulgaris]